jgi:hypothetical protein
MPMGPSRILASAFAALVLFPAADSAAQGQGPGRRTAPAPDLVPIPSRILQGTVSVRNAGSADAGPFVVTVQCQKQGVRTGGGCAEHPDLAAYANPAYPNRLVVNVPGLERGKVFNHALPFWNALVWAPGNYNFLVEADAGKTVAETNEGNNISGAVLKK